MSKLSYCVYILMSQKDNQFYIGYTTNLKQRLTDHFHGNSKATAPRRPFKLIYCEYFLSKPDAINREKYLKTSTGKRTLKLMLKESINEIRKKTQKFYLSASGGKNFFINSNGRSGCSQILSDLPKVAIKKSERQV